MRASWWHGSNDSSSSVLELGDDAQSCELRDASEAPVDFTSRGASEGASAPASDCRPAPPVSSSAPTSSVQAASACTAAYTRRHHPRVSTAWSCCHAPVGGNVKSTGLTPRGLPTSTRQILSTQQHQVAAAALAAASQHHHHHPPAAAAPAGAAAEGDDSRRAPTQVDQQMTLDVVEPLLADDDPVIGELAGQLGSRMGVVSPLRACESQLRHSPTKRRHKGRFWKRGDGEAEDDLATCVDAALFRTYPPVESLEQVEKGTERREASRLLGQRVARERRVERAREGWLHARHDEAARRLQAWYSTLRLARDLKRQLIDARTQLLDTISGATAVPCGPWGVAATCSRCRDLLVQALSLLQVTVLPPIIPVHDTAAYLWPILCASHPDMSQPVVACQASMDLIKSARVMLRALSAVEAMILADLPAIQVLKAVRRLEAAAEVYAVRHDVCSARCAGMGEGEGEGVREKAVAPDKATHALADELTAALADAYYCIMTQSGAMEDCTADCAGSQHAVRRDARVTVRRLEELQEGLIGLVGSREAARRVEWARLEATGRLNGVVSQVTCGAPLLPMQEELDVDDDRTTTESISVAAVASSHVGEEEEEEDEDQESLVMLDEDDEDDDGLHVHHSEDQDAGDDDGSYGLEMAPEREGVDPVYGNEWLVHEICILPPGRYLQVSLEEGKPCEDPMAAAVCPPPLSPTRRATAAAAGGGTPAVCEDSPEAYWANFSKTLVSGDYSPLLVLIQELCERLISITPSRADLAAEAREALDVALLEQILQRDALDSRLLFSMFRFAGERILWLEAPARNDSTEAWLARLQELEAYAESQAAAAGGTGMRLSFRQGDRQWATLVAPLFNFVLEKIDQVHVDIFNSYVRRATPACRAHGPAVERQRFLLRLSQATTTINRTHAWLCRALTEDTWCDTHTITVVDRYGSHELPLKEGLRSRREDALRMVVRRAVSMLMCTGAAGTTDVLDRYDTKPRSAVYQEDSVPETLGMDAHRLEVARHAVLCIARVCTLLAYMSQALRAQLSPEARSAAVTALMVLVPDEAVTSHDLALHVVDRVRKVMSRQTQRTIEHDEQALQLLEGRVRRTLATGDCAVLRLMHRRAAEAVHFMLDRDGAVSPAELETECAKMGLGGLAEWLGKIAELLLWVVRHHENVYLPVYDSIIRRILLADA